MKSQVPVLHAIMDQSSKMEPVLLHKSQLTMQLQAISSARPGLKILPALNVLIEPISTPMEFVLQSAHNVILSTRQLETALPASLDMMSSMEPAFILLLIPLPLPI